MKLTCNLESNLEPSFRWLAWLLSPVDWAEFEAFCVGLFSCDFLSLLIRRPPFWFELVVVLATDWAVNVLILKNCNVNTKDKQLFTIDNMYNALLWDLISNEK